MKYAIIETSGKQFWVEPQKFIEANKISIKPGMKILINHILFARNNQTLLIGHPYLNSIKIKATIGNLFFEPKIIVYKMKPKKKYKRKQGHRQQIIRIFINNIFFKTIK
jgi:large subunit ribosomal protein L21